jgi:hypothetical protein
LVLAACGKVNVQSDAAPDSPPVALVAPGVTITTHAIAGAPIQCKVTTPSTGGTAPITYTAAWTLDAVVLPSAMTMKTTFASDTVLGSATHTGHVFSCTVTATDALGKTAVAEPQGVVVDGRFAFLATQATTAPITGTLQKIDLDTNRITFIGSMTVCYAFGDLAWDSKTQTLFMVDGQNCNNDAYTLNTSTGAATFFKNDAIQGLFAAAYDPMTDKGFVARPSGFGGGLFSIDLTSGTSASLGGTTGLDGLAYDTKRHMLVGMNSVGTLFQMDETNGAATQLATSTVGTNVGMTYDPITDKLLVADFNGTIFQYDPANGYAQTTVMAFGAGDNFTGMAMLLPPPP